MLRYVAVLLLSPLMIVGTWYAGWIAVPVLAALFALVRRDTRAPREAGVAALLAWLVLLTRTATAPSFGTLLHQLGEIFPMPGWVVALLPLLLAVILAASAARVVVGVVGVRETSNRQAV